MESKHCGIHKQNFFAAIASHPQMTVAPEESGARVAM